jgi:hypothetical protein
MENLLYAPLDLEILDIRILDPLFDLKFLNDCSCNGQPPPNPQENHPGG